MGEERSRRILRQSSRTLPFGLPRLGRRRPRDYQEWLALKRWGRLPSSESLVAGYLLREAREGAGLSQQELSRRLGCSQQAISQAERWQSNPTVRFMELWARETDCRLQLDLIRRRQRE